MIKIAITQAAFDAIPPCPSAAWVTRPSAAPDGGYFVWLECRALARLDGLRQPGEGSSEVILRMAAEE
jgi:hypothetical protein